MKRVILLEPVLAHYRQDLYEAYLNCKDFNFEIIGGKNYQGIKSLTDDHYHTFNYLTFKAFKHRFYHLIGSIRFIISSKPLIIISTGVDFHLIHTIILFIFFRLFLRKKFYWWSHATLGNQGKAGIFCRKILYKASSGVFTYNRKGRENLILLGVREENIRVIGNTLNRKDYGYLNHDIYPELSNRKTFKILFSGRITEEKKLDLLIHAMSILERKSTFHFTCYIIGDGDKEPFIKLAEELDVNDLVEFAGPKYGEEVDKYFLDSDLFVYPGGIGLALVHAFSYGLPVITTDNFFIQMPEIELLMPGKTGDLYKDNSPEDLAQKILIWRDKILESRNEIKRKCVSRIEELGYLPDQVSNAVINFLKERYNNEQSVQ